MLNRTQYAIYHFQYLDRFMIWFIFILIITHSRWDLQIILHYWTNHILYTNILYFFFGINYNTTTATAKKISSANLSMEY